MNVTPHQVKKALLCGDCEEQLNRCGESGALAACLQIDGDFPLRRLLETAQPLASHDGVSLLSISGVSGIDGAALTHFALGVLWKAAATSWEFKGSPVPRPRLGPYLSRVGDYLLGGDLPDGVAVWVSVTAEGGDMLCTSFPESYAPRPGQPLRHHKFAIPGLVFLVAVGNRVPSGIYQGSVSHGDAVWLVPFGTDSLHRGILEQVQSAAAAEVARRDSN